LVPKNILSIREKSKNFYSLAFPARKFYQWDDEDSIFALLAAFFPLATIWIEKKLARFDRE
jgi:hypothetical protein